MPFSGAALALSVLALSQAAPSLAERFESWRGPRAEWRLHVEPRTGFAELLYGGAARPVRAPRDEADLAGLARAFVAETAPLTGVEEETLVLERVRFLPLAQVGSTDKYAARFEQRLGGVPVLDGSVNVLLDRAGRLLALQTTALPRLAGFPVAAALAPGGARERARAGFVQRTGLAGAVAGPARLAIARHEEAGRLRPRLVYEVEVRWSAPDTEPDGATVWIDARDGSLVRSVPNVHHLDVGGSVVTLASPGLFPDTPADPPAPLPLTYARINTPVGTVFTDANGDFLLPGATGPMNVTVFYIGTFARVTNLAGNPHFLTFTIDGTGNLLTMNPAPTELVTAQANAFTQIHHLRDWIRAVDPTDDTADFQALAEVNLTAGCNAMFDGDSVIFHRENTTLGCPNTAYTTVVAHEMGHWLNVLYHTGNVLDGMGEGNADVFAMYSYDTPHVGEGFFGPGSTLRTGLNTRLFCGDCCPNCHGPIPHDNGEVWMGAAWKLRERLNATHGDVPGDAIADALFLGWMNAFDQREIKSLIEAQWLALDDDDGYLLNGTPHYADLDGGFRDQGFPGVDLDPVWIEPLAWLPDTADVLGPYALEARITAPTSPPLATAELVYRLDGGGWQTLAMTPLGGDLYRAELPGQPAVTRVEYYLQASDAGGNAAQRPAGGALAPARFHVGLFERFFDDFEGGTNGWTQGSFEDTSNFNDDFQHGIPYGKAGDPTAAFSGQLVRGNELGAGNGSGKYQGEQHNWLRSPAIDCSASSGTRLRYRRWLSVEAATHDQARVAVNGSVLLENAPHVDTQDAAWVLFDHDISGLADGEAEVVIEFSLQSDASGNLGGWTLDDVQVLSLAPGACLAPEAYGEPKPNSVGGLARIGWTGSPSRAAADLVLTVQDGLPGEMAQLFSGELADATAFAGGLRLVRPPLVREALLGFDAGGALSWPVPIAGQQVGSTRYYQCWYRDPAAPDGTGVGLSDALAVVVCP